MLEVNVMSDTVLGGICLALLISVYLVTRWLCCDIAEEIDDEWARYERENELRKD